MSRCFLAVSAFLIANASAVAFAQPTLINTLGGPRGFGSSCLVPNDDGSSASIDLNTAFPGGLLFFGRRHTAAFVNTNGNITFRGALSTFTPDPFPVANQPMIAPYWADVDIRGEDGSTPTDCATRDNNGVWWHLEPGRMVATWDRVGYYAEHDDLQMTFQLILESRYCGTGDFDVEFRYTQCEWETGDASDGEGGFGGTPAQIGFDAGNLADFVSIMGSRMDGISRVACDGSNVDIPGVWRFQIRRGVVECPDAGDACTVDGAIGVCAEGRQRCSGAGVACEPLVAAESESCDAFDNDCDGTVDEGDTLCSGTEICDRGRCIQPCFEGGCPTGFTCAATGACLEDACDGVVCEEAERCIAGTCTGICDGVVCPAGQTCVGGSCQNLCASVECGACEVCEGAGECETRCEVTGCDAGTACDPSGHCVEEACVGVICGPGRACVGGTCLSACEDVVCPAGDVCTDGECRRYVPPARPDAGPVEETDAGMAFDAGTSDAGADGGSREPPLPPRGCSCRVPGASGGELPGGALALFALGLFVIVGRRRGSRLLPFVGVCALAVVASACETVGPPVMEPCGDSVIVSPETCDDGNSSDRDGCASLCFIEPGWECAGEPSVCTEIVVEAVCGDSMIGGTEECDDGGEGAECDEDCTLVICGDGVVNESAREECDDGNEVDGDGCTATCHEEPETCGDGTCGAGETCTNCGYDCAETTLCMECEDADGDGANDSACGGTDCNDSDPNVRPGMTEITCNRIDEDCNPATRDAVDADGDGSTCWFDCDDDDAARAPLFSPELCGDGIDNDCNEATPDIGDVDGDGALCDVDCDDLRAATCPDCPELCANSIDDDCDPATPDIFDADVDGEMCDDDCDDADATVYTDAPELCDGKDNDCNMLLDGPGEDDDRDGFASLACGAACIGSCGDCDDTNARVNPSAVEFCGNISDDDCDPATSDAIIDADGDGSTCNLDCDDSDPALVPDATSGLCGGAFDYFEDFEVDAGGWIASGGNSSWARGMPTATFIDSAASGSFAWVTNPAGLHNEDEQSYLTSPVFDLSGTTTDPTLSFAHIFQTEGTCCDEGWVDISLDGGTTWRKLGRHGEGTNWYNDEFGNYWDDTSGAPGVWRNASIVLAGAAGQANVRVRFTFVSSFFSELAEGFGVDDVRLSNSARDLAITDVRTSSAGCGGAASIQAVVQNVGSVPMPSFSLSLTVDGGAPAVEALARTLRPGETYLHTFAASAAPSVSPHVIAVAVTSPMDVFAGNDSMSRSLLIVPTITVAAATPHVEGFESNAGGWASRGTNDSWARGTPTGTFITGAGTGSFSWVTNPAGDYNNSELSYLESPCFDLSALTAAPTVSFQHIFETESGWDEGWLEMSTDGGATWAKLGASGAGTNWYNDATNQWWEDTSGAAGAWRVASIPATGAAGATVRFRFVLSTDSSGLREGFGVDQFTITP